MLKGTQPGLCQPHILVSLLLHSAASLFTIKGMVILPATVT